MDTLDAKIILAVRQAGKLLRGTARRTWFAWAFNAYAGGSPRAAETIFGWNRNAVARGLAEQSNDEINVVEKKRRIEAARRPRVETVTQNLLSTVEQLLADDCQADPQLRTGKVYTRITGHSLRSILAQSLGIPIDDLPVPRTLRRVLNRNGYALRSLRKTVPKKKIPQTDDIFGNVHEAHRRAQSDCSILRISIDNKAKVKLGPFSRGGKTRDCNQVHAADHDMGGQSLLLAGSWRSTAINYSSRLFMDQRQPIRL